MRRKVTAYYGLTVLLCCFAWSGCTTTNNGGDQPRLKTTHTNPGNVTHTKPGDELWKKESALMRAKTCDEAHTLMLDASIANMRHTLERQKSYWLDGGPMMAEDSANAGSDEGEAKDYSDTNTQVEGVDEADLVKTDGDYIYTLMGNELVIVKAWPAHETHETGRVQINGAPHALYRYGDELVILSYAQIEKHVTDFQKEDSEYNYGWYPVTLVTTVDTTQKDAPVVTKRRLIQGYTNATRRINNHVYLVQNTYPTWYGLSYWPSNLSWNASDEEIDAAYEELAQKNEEVLKNLSFDQWMPSHFVLSKEGKTTMDQAQNLVACEDVYAPKVFSGTGMVTTVTIDLDADTDTDAKKAVAGSAVVGQWGVVYASTKALYVATTDWYWWGWWGASDDDQDDDEPMFTTHVHKFTFDSDSGLAEYRASGDIQGYPLNQFSMDERDGYLRVATTDGVMWNTGNSESFVTVLAERGTKLAEVGKVGGLGLGEAIRSVRFMGERGYVVTFRQVDPLYTIDLSDPKDPQVAGELKINGFSSYMHPIDEDHLLTIGFDGTDTGQITGMALQIFDVSDAHNPTQIHKELLGEGWGWSEAAWDHHAFTYFGSKKMLAIPYSGWSENNDSYQSQLRLYRVSVKGGVQEAGAITHLGLLEELSLEKDCYHNTAWTAQIRRGLFIEDFVYSISRLGVAVHETTAVDNGALEELLLIDPSVKASHHYWNWGNNYGYCW